jgi:hypothetical protein
MKKYLEDPVLHFTASALTLIRWLLLLVVGLSAFAALGTFAVAAFVGPEFYNSLTKDSITLSRDASATFGVGLLLGSGAIYLLSRFTRSLREIVASVGGGDALIIANANRLRAMAWALAGYAVLSALTALVIGTVYGTDGFDIDNVESLLKMGIAVSILLILSRVFDQGARMREELEGTV